VSKLDDLSTCNDLIAKHGAALQRSLSELEGLRVPVDGGEKIKAVNERATLFRITSNAMINVSRLPPVPLLSRVMRDPVRETLTQRWCQTTGTEDQNVT